MHISLISHLLHPSPVAILLPSTHDALSSLVSVSPNHCQLTWACPQPQLHNHGRPRLWPITPNEQPPALPTICSTGTRSLRITSHETARTLCSRQPPTASFCSSAGLSSSSGLAAPGKGAIDGSKLPSREWLTSARWRQPTQPARVWSTVMEAMEARSKPRLTVVSS